MVAFIPYIGLMVAFIPKNALMATIRFDGGRRYGDSSGPVAVSGPSITPTAPRTTCAQASRPNR